MNATEAIPPHMFDVIHEVGDFRILVRFLNCYCIAALFYSPWLLSQMGRDVDRNTQLAVNFLFYSGYFQLQCGRTYGSINLFCPQWDAAHISDHFERVSHVNVNLPGGKVLMKNGSGISRCEIIPYEQDAKYWKYYGNHVPASQVLVPIQNVI